MIRLVLLLALVPVLQNVPAGRRSMDAVWAKGRRMKTGSALMKTLASLVNEDGGLAVE